MFQKPQSFRAYRQVRDHDIVAELKVFAGGNVGLGRALLEHCCKVDLHTTNIYMYMHIVKFTQIVIMFMSMKMMTR